MFHYEKGDITAAGRNSNEKLIAEKKNLDRKLDNLKEDDYKRVLANLQGQNTKLKEQLQSLSSKVNHLLEKRKLEKKQANKLVESQIEAAKKQLEETYKVVDHYKRQINKHAQRQLDEGLRDRYASHNNLEVQINEELTALRLEKKTLEQQIDRNSEVVREYTDDVKYDPTRFEEVATENKEMRRKLLASKKQLNEKERESQEVVDKLFTLKLEHRKRLSIQNHKNDSASQVQLPKKKTQIADVSQLKKEVDELKQKKSEIETQLDKERTEQDSRRAKIEKKIRQSLEVQKTLNREKTKALNKLNMYESNEKKLQAATRMENQSEPAHEQKGIQTQKEVSYDYRRDWAGKQAKLNCDDRLIIANARSSCFVKRMTVYCQGDAICAIKFGYSAVDTDYTTLLPFEEGVLKKLTTKTFEAKDKSYIHSFRIGLRDNQIVRLEAADTTGEKLSVGIEPQGTVFYELDIRPKERPLTMFQSFQYLGKDKYVLQSLGCEILDQ